MRIYASRHGHGTIIPSYCDMRQKHRLSTLDELTTSGSIRFLCYFIFRRKIYCFEWKMTEVIDNALRPENYWLWATGNHGSMEIMALIQAYCKAGRHPDPTQFLVPWFNCATRTCEWCWCLRPYYWWWKYASSTLGHMLDANTSSGKRHFLWNLTSWRVFLSDIWVKSEKCSTIVFYQPGE